MQDKDLAGGIEDEDILAIIRGAGAVEGVLITLVVEAEVEGSVPSRLF